MSGLISVRERPSGIATCTTLGGTPSCSASSAAVKLMSLRSSYEPGRRSPLWPARRARSWKKPASSTTPSCSRMSAICDRLEPCGIVTLTVSPPSPLNGWKSALANQAMPSDDREEHAERDEPARSAAGARRRRGAGRRACPLGGEPFRRRPRCARGAARRRASHGARRMAGCAAWAGARAGAVGRRCRLTGLAALARRRGGPRARGGRPPAPRAIGRPERAAVRSSLGGARPWCERGSSRADGPRHASRRRPLPRSAPRVASSGARREAPPVPRLSARDARQTSAPARPARPPRPGA